MTLSIRKAIETITAGQIRIPAFQRGFVWDADRVAHLMDSIYKGYPFGSLILWRTKRQLRAERKLGPFHLPDREVGFPIDYVLDGQQRLTSIFGVFQSEIAADGDASWTNIYYDLTAPNDLQESWFHALDDVDADREKYFPIKTLFNVTDYRQATSHLDDETVEQIDKVQSVLKEAVLPVQSLETDDRAKVAIVFERVNRLGVDLDVFQLLSAWTWSDEFDLQGKFAALSEEVADFGFGDIGSDTNLLLRCCAAIVAGDPAPGAVIGLNGSEVRDRFEEIENGIKGAIDFVRTALHVEKLNNLPYPTLLVPLAAFFAAPAGKSAGCTDRQFALLKRWFWRTCFARRFSADVLRNLRRDIAEIEKLKRGERSGLAELPLTIDETFFSRQVFNLRTVNSRTFILMLAQKRPLSFVSGREVSLADVLQHYNRREFHHLFPRAYLQERGYDHSAINALANFVFMTSFENKVLGGVAPSVYRERMAKKELPEVLERGVCPPTLFKDDFDSFVEERSERLAKLAGELAGE